MAEEKESWIKKTGKESPNTLLIVGIAIGIAIMFLFNKFMTKPAA